MAYQRASETEAPDPIIRDPYARALAGERGRLVVEALPIGLKDGWPIAVRTRVYDEMILEAVHSGEADAVLNLGAGLDARPYRLNLPAAVAWVEADLPAVIRYKRGVLSSAVPSCRLEQCPVDLSDAAALGALLERVGREHDRVFVLTEGLLGYLEEHAVAALASELRSVPAMKLWAAEILSPSLLPHQAALGETFRAAKIEVRFAPTQGVDFFAAYGWRPRRTSPFVDELVRFGRGDGLTLEQRAALRKGSTYVLLESGLSLA